MTLSVRTAEKKDIAALCALLTELFSIEKDFTVDEHKQRRGLALMIDSPQALVLVACIDGEPIGMVTVQTLISTAEGGNVGLVEDLVVHRDYRGRGVGKELIESLVNRSIKMNMTRLQLLADKKNEKGLAFYRSMNWSATQLVALRLIPSGWSTTGKE